jgi:2-dehydro-3-deoxyphosphooctonate aldolase (KDO 8-P synthase)
VPAFLCRQTDLLVAAGRTGKPVNIKKGQFMAPADMAYAAEKVKASGGRPLLTERGTAFGYRDLVVDMRSLIWMRELGIPVLFDGTHSVQQPGAEGGRSGGLREMVAPLVRAAVAVGVDGIYLEVHPNPDRSPSDAANCLSPEMFELVLDQVVAVRTATNR